MDTNTRHFIETIFTERGFDKSVRKLNKMNQTISTTQTKTIRQGKESIKVTQRLGKENQVLGTTLQRTTSHQNDFTNAMRRALIVAPVWMAIRAVMMSVLGAIKDIANEYKDLDKGMRKVMAVATFTADTQKKIYAELEQAAKSYFTTSSAGMKDITESMYQLGTAGLSTEQIMEGFEHVMNLSIGTFGDVTTAGRVMAGIFNVFGDELKDVGDTSKQMQYVADLLASAWKNNQIELNELNTAMGYLATSGKVVGLGLKVLVASASVMSDALLRGGKGGRLLARGFVQLAKEGKKLEDMGVYFDPTKPLDFYEVMKQLHTIYQKEGKSLVFLNELVSIFGTRGIRAVGAVLGQWEKFNEEVKRSPELINGVNEELAKSAQNTYGAILSRAWHNIISGTDIPSEGSFFKDALKGFFDFDEADENADKINTIASAISKYGDSLNLTRAQVKNLHDELGTLGAVNLAAKVRKTFGVGWFAAEFASDQELAKGADAFDTLVKRVEELTKAEKELESQTTDPTAPTKVLEDLEVTKLKQGLKYKKLSLLATSETSLVMAKMVDLLDRTNIKALALGKTTITIGDVLELNKEKIQGITEYYKDLLKLGVKAVLSAEKERLTIQKSLIDYQVDQLKFQGATLSQQIQAKILFEDSLGKERSIVEATKNELDLRKAINNEQALGVNLSSQTLKLADIANKQGIDVAKELGDLLQGRVKFAEFERNAMDATWAALAKNFPNIIKQQRAFQLLIEGVDLSGRNVAGATDIAIKEEALRGGQEMLLLNELKLQTARKEKEQLTQLTALVKQQEISDELKKQTFLLQKQLDKVTVPEITLKINEEIMTPDKFSAEVKIEGSTISEAIKYKIEQ